jgi:peptide-methionine (S)-S-oxide reductase
MARARTVPRPLLALLAVLGCVALAAVAFAARLGAPSAADSRSRPAPAGTPAARVARATFAGGCFWCMEPPFDALPGVISTTSGYTGGHDPDPTYEEVSSGGTGHLEAVQVVYDPQRVGYAKLLEVFWRNVDPLDPAGQFCDKGEQYETAIFVHDAEQRRLAEASLAELAGSKRLKGRIVTPIRPAETFHPAEEYHQDYYRKNPLRYNFYRSGCGRDRRLRELWGDAAGAH